MKSEQKLFTYQYHHFLDEAGDPTFCGKGKSVIVGTPGASTCYILGMVKFNNDLDTVRKQVMQLQQQVDQDPYFKKMGSIEKKRNKYGFYFHATDDIPEVRMQFFKYFSSLDCTFEAVVGSKNPDLYLTRHNENPHEFYADLLSHLLYNKLFSKNRLVLNIAERGTSTRLENLKSGLQKAEEKFHAHNPKTILNHNIVFNVQNQTSEPLLNIADYFCWSVQRVFERGETRYYEYLLDKIEVVVDLYDEEGMKTGNNIYTPKKPLTDENKKDLYSI
jgi:uncharacterized phage-like protein YoqJ